MPHAANRHAEPVLAFANLLAIGHRIRNERVVGSFKHDVWVDAKRLGVGGNLVQEQAALSSLQLGNNGLWYAQALCHLLLR